MGRTRGAKERRSEKKIATCRANAQKRRGHAPTRDEKFTLEALKARARLVGFPAVADVCIETVVRYRDEMFGKRKVRASQRVRWDRFESSAKFLSDRCGWPTRTEQEIADGRAPSVIIERAEFPRPETGISINAAEVANTTNGKSTNGAAH